jgi:hypothetical protein
MTDEGAATMTDDAISEAKTAIEQAVGCPRECTTYGTGCYCDIAARAALAAALPLIVARERAEWESRWRQMRDAGMYLLAASAKKTVQGEAERLFMEAINADRPPAIRSGNGGE